MMNRCVEWLSAGAMLMAMATVVCAQVPGDVLEPMPMTREQLQEQRRIELRSLLRGQQRGAADEVTGQPAAGWNLSPEDRAELRQQLRQDKRKPDAQRP